MSGSTILVTTAQADPAMGAPLVARRGYQLSVAVILLWFTLVELVPGQSAHWIWPREQRAAGTTARIQRSFTTPAQLQRAHLSGVADFCTLEVRVNGSTVAAAEPFDQPFHCDITRWLRASGQQNQLQIVATSSSGPAALALRLELTALDGSRQVVVSDASWPSEWTSGDRSAAAGTSADLGEVREFELDPLRQFGITALDDYEQWKQSLQLGSTVDPSSFAVLPGFEISLLRSARPEEGSWVSMAFDPQGRLTIGREERGLLRMTLAADGQSVAKVETVNDTLLECRGLLYAYDALYANANNSKGLYRLRDTDGDDQFDQVQLLRQFEGSVGHGRNDLTLGPDGMIYLIHGDSVDLIRDAEDLTSTLREHRRGEKTSEGHLLRTDRDGRHWQVLSAGLRNPYGIAFHSDGEPFTYDADAEFDMGAPWYRPTQVKHLTRGSDFGWRGVTGRWPPYFPDHPDNAPPTVTIGKGSPTSVKFGYASRFPPALRQALYILDWAYGRIIAVHLTPRGASYAGRAETFLRGRPLNVTDLDFGPDGAMYFVTGGRKTQAGLYRVRYVGANVAPAAWTLQQQARTEHGSAARALRRRLERLLTSPAGNVVDAAWLHLDSSDPWIRYAARTVIERQPAADWRQRALDESRTTAALAAILALVRAGETALYDSVVRKLNRVSLGALTTAQKAAALYAYQQCLTGNSPVQAESLREALRRLDASYPDPAPEVNRYLSLILAQHDMPSAVPKTMALLATELDQAQQLHYLFALRGVRCGWTPDLRRAYADAWRRSETYLGGQGMPGFLKQIRDDTLAAMSPAEREQFASLLEPQTQLDSEPLPQRPIVQQWTIHELDDLLADSSGNGDRQRGKQLFQVALCARCHRVGGLGQLVGPDLTGVGGRFSRRDILQSILDPSQVVAENYRNERIETADGRVLVGRILQSGDFRSPSLRMVTDPLQPGKFTEVLKRDVVSHTALPTSPMPAGLLNTLSRQEILDLLAFVESGL